MTSINLLKRKLLQTKELNGIPKLRPFDFSKEKQKLPEGLLTTIGQKHREYISSVSSPEMAASLELSTFILSYCFTFKPLRLLDLGSGFSSFILRTYKDLSGENVEVYSVDDDTAWLEKTREYMQRKGLSADQILSLEQFSSLDLKDHFDLILLDLNFIEVRKNFLDFAKQRLSAKGLLIIDDVHKVEFLRDVKKFASGSDCQLFNIRKETLDHFGRFAIALTK